MRPETRQVAKAGIPGDPGAGVERSPAPWSQVLIHRHGPRRRRQVVLRGRVHTGGPVASRRNTVPPLLCLSTDE